MINGVGPPAAGRAGSNGAAEMIEPKLVFGGSTRIGLIESVSIFPDTIGSRLDDDGSELDIVVSGLDQLRESSVIKTPWPATSIASVFVVAASGWITLPRPTPPPTPPPTSATAESNESSSSDSVKPTGRVCSPETN